MEYEAPFAGPLRQCFALLQNPFLQILAGAQGLLDARAGIADHQFRRLSGERLRQVYVPAGELYPHLVGDLRQRALALVVALADQPLPEELLVEHLLVLAAAESLFAAVGDPVAAGVRGVDLVDDPQLALGVDAELVLGVHQDQARRGGGWARSPSSSRTRTRSGG